jgi:hypothetical protein
MHDQLHEVPRRSFLRRLGYIGAVALLAVGCHSLPFMPRTVVCATVPFEYGTNATLAIQRDLKEAGAYDLYLVLDSDGIPRDEYGHWPIRLLTRFHVLVWTNGRVTLDQEISHLGFGNSDKCRVAYALTGFATTGPAAVKCLVHDLSDGRIRAQGCLALRRSFAK